MSDNEKSTFKLMVGEQEVSLKGGPVGDVELESHVLSPSASAMIARHYLDRLRGQPMTSETLNRLADHITFTTGRKTKVTIHIDMEGDA